MAFEAPKSDQTTQQQRRCTVFVTVGSTKFDALIKALDTPKVAEELATLGFTDLIIQLGAGDYRPQQTSARLNTKNVGLNIEWFEFTPSIGQYLSTADVVISHAGSGSIFETLRLNKPLVAVPNPVLMDDHQKELADKLAKEGYLVAAPPEGEALVEAVRRCLREERKVYRPGNVEDIVTSVDQARKRWFGF